MSPIIKVSLGFANGMPDNTLITFCRKVHARLYPRAVVTHGPVPARPRTDHNPLDRREYLLNVTRRVGS